MLTAKPSTFPTAVLLGLLILLFASCAPPGDTDRQLEELRADVDALGAELRRLNGEVAALKGVPGQPATAQVPDKPTGPMSLSVGASAVLGSESAPVTMFAYNDYTCTECASYATDVLPEIVSRYVDTGSLRIVMREYPNREAGKRALQTARLAVCAGRQGKYLEMHDWLYANRAAGAKGEMQAFVQQLGLDSNEFRSCMRGEDVQNQLRANMEEARESPIQSAPGFQFGLTDPDDPERVTVTLHLDGSLQLADFQAAIDELLIAAGASN